MTSKQRKLRVPFSTEREGRVVERYDSHRDIAQYAEKNWRPSWPIFRPSIRFYALAIAQRHGVDFEPPT